MATSGRFILIGENIHCSRSRPALGKRIAAGADGGVILLFSFGGAERSLPVPERFVAREQGAAGKVKHVAAALWQGLRGSGEEALAGADYLRSMAMEQAAAGAAYLDLNVDEFGDGVGDRVEAIRWLAGLAQEASDLPLSVDSSDPRILEAGLAAVGPTRAGRKALVNSVSLERSSMIPAAARAGAAVIAGATGESRMPADAQERIGNLLCLVRELEKAGFTRSDIFLDPLVFPVSVGTGNPGMVLDAIEALRSELGDEIHFAPGFSNVSFGLPRRALINLVFARLCLERGCDGGIADPLAVSAASALALDTGSGMARLAEDLLLGRDEDGMGWISACRETPGKGLPG
jgi:cobalamin-dependent methionine synthase I